MNPEMLRALIAALGRGSIGGPGQIGPGGGAPALMTPPAAGMMPQSPAIQNMPPPQPRGGGAGTFGSPSAPGVGNTTGNDFALRASPGAMPTPAPMTAQGMAGQPPTGGGGMIGGAGPGAGAGGAPSVGSGGAAEPTESAGPSARQSLPDIPRTPLGALLMPQSFGGGGVPGMAAGGPTAGAGVGGQPPSNPWTINPLMAAFMNRMPTGMGGAGG